MIMFSFWAGSPFNKLVPISDLVKLELEKIIYPIGRGNRVDDLTPENNEKWINDIAGVPNALEKAVSGLTDEQLDTPYREGGWTIRQIVHHLADSNINSYTRFKLAVTEENPTIKTWEQSNWAFLEDTKMAVDVSIHLLEYLHLRWVKFLRSLTPSDLERTFIHPDGGEMSVAENVWNYSWHSLHHIAQITTTRERKGWS